MDLSRTLLVLMASSTLATFAAAELTENNDRLAQLSQTLSRGSYVDSSDELDELEDTSSQPARLGKDSITLRAHGIKEKIKSNVALALNRENSNWMVAHPLPNTRVSSTFGMRSLLGTTRHHSGLDLAAPSGTPIYATGSGIVTKSGWGNGYGNYVEIDHGNGFITRYAHASRLNVSVGQTVRAGQQVANVGCTGRCTGPHLHYEVVRNGQRQNPAPYLALLPE